MDAAGDDDMIVNEKYDGDRQGPSSQHQSSFLDLAV